MWDISQENGSDLTAAWIFLHNLLTKAKLCCCSAFPDPSPLGYRAFSGEFGRIWLFWVLERNSLHVIKVCINEKMFLRKNTPRKPLDLFSP